MAAVSRKRTVGDHVRVEADIFTDGHDALPPRCWRVAKARMNGLKFPCAPS